ncbi:NADH-ubiquinone/plastoquinone (complex I) protein [Medicago truncatula]|uniref:NADH-ubiquinone/plastoquinone (Complex I) protein n=1 Tax=Medicago truncatula TaxID=3880 RepID=G7KRU0_MEDTR|nr:NADH-ubiquinone/plastoquinone (complex I) protein [Medicago truncatula]
MLPLVLHEMEACGLVRINIELFSHAHSIFCPWLMILGSIQIIYADSTSFGQCNLKKKAYSSVSHIGFIILGIGSISDIGLNGPFFLAGTSYDKLRLLYLNEMGGMAIPMPKIFTIFIILSMTSLALSGMSGFVAELIVFFFWNNY